MNKTTVFVLIGAFIAAFLVAVVVSMAVSNKSPKTQAVVETPVTEVLLAAKNLPIGTTLADNSVRWQPWPEEKIPENAVVKGKKEAEGIIGRKVRRAILKDEVITPAALIPEATGGYMAAALDDGMRAVSIDVKASSSVAGFVTPGDHVDVLVVYRVKVRTNNPQALQRQVISNATETVLSNVRVLAVDQRSDSTSGDKVAVGKTVTLEVTPKQAEALATAEAMGDLRLALRQMGDDKSFNSGGTTDVSISDTLQKAVSGGDGGVGLSEGTVRIYSGSGMEEVPMRGSSKPATDGKKEEEEGEE